MPGTSGSIGNGILGEYFPEREYNLLDPKRTRKRPKFQPWSQMSHVGVIGSHSQKSHRGVPGEYGQGSHRGVQYTNWVVGG